MCDDAFPANPKCFGFFFNPSTENAILQLYQGEVWKVTKAVGRMDELYKKTLQDVSEMQWIRSVWQVLVSLLGHLKGTSLRKSEISAFIFSPYGDE